MSSVVISGDTSGAITLAAPAVAGTTTLTLPATTGTVIASDASANIQFNSGYGSVATAYGCRAWVNFNGTGTVAIRASGNVTSITDNGTGDYTVNFTTAMPDANYAVCSMTNKTSTAARGGCFLTFDIDNSGSGNAPTTSAIRIRSFAGSDAVNDGVAVDVPNACIAIFR